MLQKAEHMAEMMGGSLEARNQMAIERISTLLCAGVILAASPSFAHHSAAMFDRTKEVVLTGTIKEFQYTAPHSWVQIVVENENGETVEWSVEGSAPNVLLRRGIKPTSLVPGEKVSIRANPMSDGQPGALIIDVTKEDGSVVSF